MPDPVTIVTTIFTSVVAKLTADTVSEALKPLKKKTVFWKNKFNYENAAKEYTENLIYLYGKIRVIGMEKAIPLEGVYTDVNILSKLSGNRSLPQVLAEKVYLGQAEFGEVIKGGERRDGLDVLRKNDKLFILGKPGAGKTTFLKHVLLEAIHGRLFEEVTRQYIPICIILKDFSESGLLLMDYITKQFDICHFEDAAPFIEAILLEGRAIILCDGLDEVAKEKRNTVITELRDLSNKYFGCPFLVTCRIAAAEYTLEKFRYVEMADFSEEQIRTFVKNWFNTQGDVVKSEKFFQEFLRDENKKLQELARTPLLLAMLCLIFEEHLSFPVRQSQVYEQAVDALLHKWYAFRGVKHELIYKDLDVDRKKQMFALIAARYFDKNRYIFDKNDIIREIVDYLSNLATYKQDSKIEGEKVLKTIEAQHGIFVERARGFYTYSHLSIQEFFTSRYILDMREKGSLQGLLDNHLFDDKWKEVIQRTSESLSEADCFFDIWIKAMDRFARQTPRIVKMLKYLNILKSSDSTVSPPVLKNRSGMIIVIIEVARTRARALALARTNDRDRALASTFAFASDLERALDRDSDRDSTLALANDRNLARDRASARTRDRDRDLDRDRALDRALALARDRASVFTSTRARDLARDRTSACDHSIKSYFEEAFRISKELNLKALHKKLLCTKIPVENDSAETWRTFSDQLFDIFKQYRPYKEYEFTGKEANQLSRYLYGVKLCVDCLKVAYVSDREAIEDRLLRVPDGA